ncbi:hypothetical protein E2C01_088381 [Portunus trituberculatus]|uniref:Uncharacterized protein n=1 Tax=Portunus trituberculatus TaxID=210409 RepID=A0A5B7JJ80_PORTR|nr:hypothetical protein [Portunus trituberculatus]
MAKVPSIIPHFCCHSNPESIYATQ